MNKSINTVSATYAPFFKGWAVKQLGAKPTDAALTAVHGLGLRPGKQALAVALAMRPEGVTGSQIVMATGAPQLNRMRGLIGSGVVKRHAAPANGQGHTVYMLTLTPKGETAIKRKAEAEAKAALDGGTAKPAKVKKATAKKVTAPRKPRTATLAVAEAPVTAPVTEVAPQGDTAPAGE